MSSIFWSTFVVNSPRASSSIGQPQGHLNKHLQVLGVTGRGGAASRSALENEKMVSLVQNH